MTPENLLTIDDIDDAVRNRNSLKVINIKTGALVDVYQSRDELMKKLDDKIYFILRNKSECKVLFQNMFWRFFIILIGFTFNQLLWLILPKRILMDILSTRANRITCT